MGLVNALELRVRWLSFPGLIRAIAIIHLFVFALLVLRPELETLLVFDWAKIQKGEFWRIISYYALPPVTPGPGFYPYIGMGIVVYVAFLIGDQLEHAWGSFRTSVFTYGTIICQTLTLFAICAFIAPIGAAWGSALFYQAIFFSFATLFPRYQFRLMFAIPVPAFVLALGSSFFGLVSILGNPIYFLYALGSLLPFIIWAGPVLIGYLNNRAATQIRRAKFSSKVSSENRATFHNCISCGATEHTHPNRNFRVTPEDTELCTACLGEE